jgi:hypothetical protein
MMIAVFDMRDFLSTFRNLIEKNAARLLKNSDIESMKWLNITAAFFLLPVVQIAQAKDKEPSRPPLIIPVAGSAQSTTSPLGNSQVTRTSTGQSFSTSQLGSTTITRDNSGNTWRTTKVGSSYVTQGPNGQTQTTTKLGNSYITRDSSSGTTLTTSPLGNSYQTRSNSGASWSTSQLGGNYMTRETSPAKDSKPALIVIPGAK